MATKSKFGVVSEGASSGEIPPAPTNDTSGKVEVSDTAIATIAADAVLDCYGVVGLAQPRRGQSRRVAVLPTDERRRGVVVQSNGDQITIDLYVIIEYGIRISEVAHSIMTTVKFEVERALGMPIEQVNVNVQGLRFSDGAN